jgi:sphingomyelin phosphodiesterase
MSSFGFYATERLEDNLKIISLNTNFSYLLNFWIYIADADPENMFHWLIDQLQESEDRGQDVYIIGHIAPGGFDVSKFWSAAFYDIVARYEDTIVGQFYGHTHRDEFQIFYNNDSRERAGKLCTL